MKYKGIKKKAIRIDKFIDKNRRYLYTLPMGEIVAIIKYLFPSCYTMSKGWFKTVFTICPQRGSKGEMLILKVGKAGSIKNDIDTWKRVPRAIREKHFAKIHWHTKYSLLQEWGREVAVTEKDIEKLKQIGAKYGLIDIQKKNIRKVNGALKIIDASVFIPGKTKRMNRVTDYINIKFS
jgi:hypothetical protein